jgi:hypothetical protein
MKNKPGQGPTNPSKTLERMAQERNSPGASSVGGNASDAPGNDTTRLPEAHATTNSDASAHTAERRGDSARTKPEPTPDK